MSLSYENQRAEELRQRTRSFGIEIIQLCGRFPRTVAGYVIARQLMRAATSVAANYRAACRSRSRNDFLSRISVVAEEADESQFWLDVSLAANVVQGEDVRRLLKEATELTAIFTASRATVKRGRATVMAILAVMALLALARL